MICKHRLLLAAALLAAGLLTATSSTTLHAQLPAFYPTPGAMPVPAPGATGFAVPTTLQQLPQASVVTSQVSAPQLGAMPQTPPTNFWLSQPTPQQLATTQPIVQPVFQTSSEIPRPVTQASAVFPQPDAVSQPSGAAFPSQDDPLAERTIYQPTYMPVTIAVPNLPSAWQFHAGLLYLRPNADNLGWGILTTEQNYQVAVPLASPHWEVETLRPSYQPGFEIGTGYTFANSGRDFQLNWQHLRTSDVQYQAVQGPGQWISPFSQTGPPTADNFAELDSLTGVKDLLSANAVVNFHYDSVTADFGQFIDVAARLRLRLFSGLNYANLYERLVSSFFGNPPTAGQPFPFSVPMYISLNNTSTFWGLGPRVGLDSTYQTRRGLTLNGQMACAGLIGQTQPGQYQFTATAPALQNLGTNYEYVASQPYTHVVFTANAKLGVGYSRTLSNGITLSTDGGYMAVFYSNPFSTYETNENIIPLDIGSLSSGSIRHTLSNFTLDGFYWNVGMRW